MKKIISILAVIVMVFALTLSAFAASESEAQVDRLIEYLKSLQANTGAATVTLTAENIQTAQNYLDSYINENELTAEMADEIIAHADEAKEIVAESGITDIKELSEEKRTEIINIANTAAAVVDVEIKVDTGAKEVVYASKTTGTTIAKTGTTLKVTGTGMNATALVITAVAIVAVIGCAVIPFRKVKEN